MNEKTEGYDAKALMMEFAIRSASYLFYADRVRKGGRG